MTLKSGSKPRRRQATLSGIAAVRKLEAGLPFHSIRRLQRSLDLPLEEVATLVRISPRTLARRKREGKFNFDESERLFRLTTVLDRALELFEGDEAAARRWLQKSRPIFDNQSGLELARSEIGAGEVKDLIGRLEHGVFS